MLYLLDSNVLINFDRNNPATVAFVKKHDCCTCAISVLEFNQYTPVQIGQQKTFNELFLDMPVLPFDQSAAIECAKQVQWFRSLRTPKGKLQLSYLEIARLTMDTMIASIAICNNASLVTDNQKDFSLIAGIQQIKIY